MCNKYGVYTKIDNPSKYKAEKYKAELSKLVGYLRWILHSQNIEKQTCSYKVHWFTHLHFLRIITLS
jgi:hypothetical protein